MTTAMSSPPPAISERQRLDDVGALTLTKLIHSNVALGGAHRRYQISWRTALVSALISRTPDRSIVATTATSAAALGCLDAATEAWVESDGKLQFEKLLDDALALYSPHNQAPERI